jgi:uncharacterized protein (TIGR02271 family)
MSSKLVGFYNSRERAEQVKDDLVEAGFGRSDVSIYEGKDEPGLWDKIRDWFGYADEEDRNLYHEAARRGGVAVTVDTSDEDTPDRGKAEQIMQRHNPIDLEGASQQWRAQGWKAQSTDTASAEVTRTTRPTTGARPGQTERPPTTSAGRPGATSRGKEDVIPVAEEHLEVGKKAVLRGGVRVHSRVVSKPVEQQVNLRDEHARVERRPTDRTVASGEQVFQERNVEVTESTEQPVVRKDTRITEEVVVGKDVEQRTETVRDSVRRTEVDVEKLGPDAGDNRIASEFAAELARDKQYGSTDWETGESNFRRSFEQRYPNSRWEQVKDSVRREYNRIRNKV